MCKYFLLLLLLVSVRTIANENRITSNSSIQNTPSFDCNKSSNDVEREICNSENLNSAQNGTLKQSDRTLAKVYKRAKAALVNDASQIAALTASQRKWAKNRQFCFEFGAAGENESCLLVAYDQRISFLKSIIFGKVMPNITRSPVQPFTCERFGSWQTHWEKSANNDAKELLEILFPEIDNCWQQLGSKNRDPYGDRRYYARNLMQLSLEAGVRCKEISGRFDRYVLSQENLWSLSTDYVASRLKCLPEDIEFSEEIRRRAESLRLEYEILYKKIAENFIGSSRIAEFENRYKRLQTKFLDGTIIEKLVEASYAKQQLDDALKESTVK